ncbi:MAG: Rrf2 family transcriptional regulator [candidate division WOR-3 bacterium]|nr:Rrf2 family transcriptional regulator [candidate division WOR-3 bacterium]MCX7836579.1 Rrf2 family transcriptional regulator [candidate division WOR-3 bacterium]MDW8114169.1 Rrf2 family transcriptional regulator [candidate division WOR-3 bacterium]
MKITTILRYGLRLMIEMAKSYQREPLSLRIIAKKQKIPIKYAEKIIHLLLRAGLVKSVRGKEGGYLLALKPKEIKVLDIFRALEGEIYLVDCVLNPKVCQRSKYCEARRLWQLLSESWQRILNKLTLKSLLKGD